MIKVLRKKLIKAEKDASLYHVELVCDEISEMPLPSQYNGWIIDMGSIVHVINSGETYRLNSSGKWILQKKTSEGGVIFTEADKEKLDSLTNPILLKGRVDTKKELEKIPDPETGWLYFVGSESDVEFAEYIFSEAGKWEFIGLNNVNLSEYVKKTDHAVDRGDAGVVKVNSDYGVNSVNGELRTVKASTADIQKGTEQFKPIVPSMLADVMNSYGIMSKTFIGDMRGQAALNKSALGLQKKNLLKNSCQDYSRSGVDATVNSDGSIRLSGKNENNDRNLIIYSNLRTGATDITEQFSGSERNIPAGNYILSGGTANCRVQLRVSKVENDEGTSYLCSGTEIPVTITEDDKYVWCRISIATNAEVDDVIRPMLRCAEITDGTYEPYVPDLQEQINELKAQINALKA